MQQLNAATWIPHPVRGIGESVYIYVRLRKRDDEMRYRRWYKMFSADTSGVVLRVVGWEIGSLGVVGLGGGIALHQRLFTKNTAIGPSRISRGVRNDRIFCVLLISGFFSFSFLFYY